jgi:hypothetical protein
MSREFVRSGFHLDYPDDWKADAEETDDGWSATFFSPDTAFLMLSFHRGEDDPSAVADMALEAMRESYPDLEAELAVETLGGRPAVGHDLDFFTLDLTNTCLIRALAVPEGCLLMMSQCTDDELPTNGPLLRAICHSLTIDEDAVE